MERCTVHVGEEMIFFPSDYRLIIQFVGFHTPEDEWKGYLYAVVIFVVAVIQSICLHQYFIRVMVVGMRLRTAVMSIVYKKVGHGWEGWTRPLVYDTPTVIVSVMHRHYVQLVLYITCS